MDSGIKSDISKFKDDMKISRIIQSVGLELSWGDKERYVMGLTEDVECHLNVNNLQSAYQALKTLL